jgi:uncharacterized protein YjbI with pentapeptide repeats
MSENQRYEVRLKAVTDAPAPFSGRLVGVRFDPSTTSARFVKAWIDHVDFSGLDIEGFYAQEAIFEHCDFTGAKLHEGSLSTPPASIYRDCHFDRARLRFQDPGVARFERCSFDHTVIDHWICGNSSFVDCTFVGRFRDIEFSGGMNPTLPRVVPMHANEFRGNDFSQAKLIDVEFTGGIDLDAQKLPAGPEYHRFDIRPETVARVESLIPSLPAEEQENALSLVRWLRGRYAGQSEAFTNVLREFGFGLYQKLLEMLGEIREK